MLNLGSRHRRHDSIAWIRAGKAGGGEALRRPFDESGCAERSTLPGREFNPKKPSSLEAQPVLSSAPPTPVALQGLLARGERGRTDYATERQVVGRTLPGQLLDEVARFGVVGVHDRSAGVDEERTTVVEPARSVLDRLDPSRQCPRPRLTHAQRSQVRHWRRLAASSSTTPARARRRASISRASTSTAVHCPAALARSRAVASASSTGSLSLTTVAAAGGQSCCCTAVLGRFHRLARARAGSRRSTDEQAIPLFIRGSCADPR